MKRLVFVCDICEREIEDPQQIEGIFFPDKSDILAGANLRLVNPSAAKKHICRSCKKELCRSQRADELKESITK
jgi:hypothetical protein